MDTNRDILISGARVAGPALAWWLSRHGFRGIKLSDYLPAGTTS